MKMRKGIVIGAGIGGLTAAAAMRRAGIEVEIYERARELREAGAALGIMSNAVAALRSIGIHGALEANGEAIDDFQIFDTKGELIAVTPLKQLHAELGFPSISIHRAALQRILIDAVGDSPIHLGAACEHIELLSPGVRVYFSDGHTAEADFVVGADGLHSAVRRQLHGDAAPRYAGYAVYLATIPFSHPRLVRGYTGHYWGKGTRFGLVDIGSGQFYWWATRNCARSSQQQTPDTCKQELQRNFSGWADEVEAAISATPAREILRVDAQDRPFITRWGTGPVTLLGDAAHPMLTSLGQGACMAIEDAVILGRVLAAESDVERGLRRYEDLRRARTRQIVKLSRVMSAIEQAQHPVTAALRDTFFRMRSSKSLWEQTRPIFTFENATV
jgi:2-polyprenyl-6-methoxyphenol hydroxylase-like FAD-dependent oxidoreductase